MADVVIAGAAGRMGSRLVSLLQDEKDMRLVAALEAPGHPSLLKDAGEVAGISRLGVPLTADPEGALGKDRILIEFSVPDASLAHLRLVARDGGRAVIGTTGFSAAQMAEVEGLATQAPILLSPNMSLAVNVAFHVLAEMARLLGEDYDVEITDTYHWAAQKEVKRYEWEAGDVIYIPPNTASQHFNADPERPVRLISAVNRIYKASGLNDLEQLEDAPEYRPGAKVTPEMVQDFLRGRIKAEAS